MNSLRRKLVRLAYSKPQLRGYLLPLIRKAMMVSPVTFRKTQQGDWVVMMPAGYARVGDTVVVTKKDGHTKNVQIVSIRRPFNVQGKPYVYCEFRDSTARPVLPAPSKYRTCDNCGANIIGPGAARVDSSGIRGVVCRDCAHESSYALSFG